jgi:hypothetical protein
MNDRAKLIGEALAIVGVIASLIFVAVEVRQNTNAVHGATLQAVSQQSLDLVMAGLDNPELRLAFKVAGESKPEALSEEQELLLIWFFSAKLRADENRFRQIELGILDQSNLEQLGSNIAYRLPFFRDWWIRNGGFFAADFQALVEQKYLPLSPVQQDSED